MSYTLSAANVTSNGRKFKRLEALEILENQDTYEVSLQKRMDSSYEDIGLYVTILKVTKESGQQDIHSIHVLAESEEGAISQAEAMFKLSSWEIPNDAVNVYAQAYRQPLLIRGWGSKTF